MNKKDIKHTFNAYPTQEELFATSDGIIFLTKNDAENYAREKKLTDLSIQTITKADAEGDDVIEEATEPKTEKHIVTQDDLDNNPELVEEGVNVGDEIDVEITEDNSTPATAEAVSADKVVTKKVTKKASTKK